MTGYEERWYMLSQEFMASFGKKLVAEYVNYGNSTYLVFWDEFKKKWCNIKVRKM